MTRPHTSRQASRPAVDRIPPSTPHPAATVLVLSLLLSAGPILAITTWAPAGESTRPVVDLAAFEAVAEPVTRPDLDGSRTTLCESADAAELLGHDRSIGIQMAGFAWSDLVNGLTGFAWSDLAAWFDGRDASSSRRRNLEDPSAVRNTR